MKITVIWEKLLFCYLQPLYTITEVWEEIRRVVEKQRNKVPRLPNPDMIDPNFIICLSSDDLRDFGESARQIQSVFHIIIDDGTFIHKMITHRMERRSLDHLKRKATNTPKHFIVPVEHEQFDVFRHTKVRFDPLEEEQARWFLRTLVRKIHEALTELHGLGVAHTDIRLTNICFNSAYEAVLIDLDRCTHLNGYPTAVSMFGTESCMYLKPELIDVQEFNGGHLDYSQLGWLVAWVLSDHSEEEDYHKRKWLDQDQLIKDDQFVSTLVCKGTYDPFALETSQVVVDEPGNFAELFQAYM